MTNTETTDVGTTKAGTRIASLRWAALLTLLLLAGGAAPATGQTLSAIYVMNADGGEVRKISHVNERWLGSPALSHDGKRVLYDAAPPTQNYRECRLCLETLAPAPQHPTPKDPAAKAAADKGPTEKDPAGDGPAPDAAGKVVDLGFGCAPRWSPDDKQLAFFLGAGHAGGEKPGVYVMNLDGQGREWIGEGQRPRWSPDGEKIVVASNHEGFESVYVHDLFEQQTTRVLERGYDQISGACWSPDGKRLAFIGYKGGGVFSGGKGELAIVAPAAGQTPQVVRFDRLGWQPDWSPDGKRLLAWISFDGQERLQLFDPEGLEQRFEFPGQAGAHNTDAVFSPDGKQILFGSARGD